MTSNWTASLDGGNESSGWSCFNFVAPIFPTFAEGPREEVVDDGPLDLYVLAGQSNMAGRGGVIHTKSGLTWDGVLPPPCEPAPGRILRFNATGKWEDAAEPVHQDIDSTKVCGVGPGLAFAKELLAMDPETKIGLIPCAIGGTCIDLWTEDGKLFVNSVHRTLAALTERPNSRLRGLLWYQGESDADTEEHAASYQAKLEDLLQAFRKALNQPALPIVQVAITSTREEVPFVNQVRQAQYGAGVDNMVTVDARGFHLQDGFHLSTFAQCKLAKEMAAAYVSAFREGPQEMDAPPVDAMANGRQDA